MHGNVWEWVEDCWNDNYKAAPSDGSARTTGDCSRRVLRGGSLDHSPRSLRWAFHGWDEAVSQNSFIGLRVARTLSA